MLDDRLIDDCWAAARSGDLAAFQDSVQPLLEAALAAGDDGDAEAALNRIAGLFEVVPLPVTKRLAMTAAALIQRGAPAGPVIAPICAGVRQALVDADAFAGTWVRMFGPKSAMPHPHGDQDSYAAAIEKLVAGRRFPRRPGLSRQDAIDAANGWFTVGEWVAAGRMLLERREARVAMPDREHTAALAEALSVLNNDVYCLAEQLAVLDEVTLIVVHRTEPVAYQVRISGVAENFQLYVLLADALPGYAPDPEWVAAASTGDPAGCDRIEAAFQLSDRYGNYVPIEGRPHEIPVVEGCRLLVIDPPPYGRSWDHGRRHDTRPEVVLERTLDAGEAATWRARAGALLATATRNPAHYHHSRRRGVVELTG